MDSLAQGIVDSFNTSKKAMRKEALTDQIGNLCLDTCDIFGECWETAIGIGDGKGCLGVEQYKDRDAAVIGHLRWLERVKKGMTVKEAHELHTEYLDR